MVATEWPRMCVRYSGQCPSQIKITSLSNQHISTQVKLFCHGDGEVKLHSKYYVHARLVFDVVSTFRTALSICIQ